MSRNILIVLPSDRLGGSEKVLKMIASYYLRSANVIVYFLQKSSTHSWDDLLVNTNIRLVYGKFNSSALGIISLVRFVRKFRNYHMVYSSQTVLSGIIGILIKIKLIKTNFFIARESTMVFRRFDRIRLAKYKLMYRLGYSSVDLVICQTGLMKEDLIANLPNASRRMNIEVIPNPIVFEINLNSKFDDFFGEEYIVAAGRLIHIKGFDILIEAFNLVKNDYPNLKLLILGEGPIRGQLEKTIKDLDISNRVLLPGHVTDLLDYYKFAKVCVISSRVEGFPNVLLEMMSQNTSIIATRCAGDIDILGVALVETNDIHGMSEALKVVLDLDTSCNRKLFDNELRSRSINRFICKIESVLNG